MLLTIAQNRVYVGCTVIVIITIEEIDLAFIDIVVIVVIAVQLIVQRVIDGVGGIAVTAIKTASDIALTIVAVSGAGGAINCSQND